tara:strand:+ start:186 stop:560 length:375 start_codon:yes stop_codon:yes gene_type:complete
MKVGDVVIQGSKLIKLRGLPRSKLLGVVIAAHDQDQRIPEKWRKNLGQLIDVMWSSGKISKNFAENALIVIASDEVLQEERDILNINLSSDMIENGLKPIDIAVLGQAAEYDDEIELYKTYGGD